MDKKELTNSGAIWKNEYKKDKQPDFRGPRTMSLNIKVGDTPYGAEPINNFDDLVTYDKEGNAFPFLVKDNSGKIVGVNAIFDVSSWKRPDGASQKHPVLSFKFALAATKPKSDEEIPFPSGEERKGDKISPEDIPF
jgi:hypothetical protein